MKGKLYIVATPIGHLKDMTFRAVEILKGVPFVLAEDTRESKKLLDRYEITTQLISYRDQNHERIFRHLQNQTDQSVNLQMP